ncbi:glycoprotein-N-acetylgalactosamine 3-beta-galactosyltransferase 1-like [Cloeon dipterum]|uniref:glycoprotein-N-acetylgalactosamine 3-beta-galactosyltransferase 1-like n=1 Tax=Cloeon dipterum TaxID=197152 RepID=UPI00322016B9
MKTFHAFKYIYKHHFGKYDWFLKADDDTYIVMENLKKMLAAHSSEEPRYFGLHMKQNDERMDANLAPDGYMTGAAYVLSSESLKRLATHAFRGETPNCSLVTNETGEDLLMAQCLHQVGVKPADTRDSEGNNQFSHFDVETMVNGNLSEEYWYWRHVVWPQPEGNQQTKVPISFHYMAPHKFYFMESLIYNTKIVGVKNLQMFERENYNVSLSPIART